MKKEINTPKKEIVKWHERVITMLFAISTNAAVSIDFHDVNPFVIMILQVLIRGTWTVLIYLFVRNIYSLIKSSIRR